MSTPTTEQYKGHDLIVLNPEAKFPFKFGQAKAKLIIEHIDTVSHFADTGCLPDTEKADASN